MSGNSFDYIAQELLKQKNVMDALRAENRELHRQLAELREGQGILIEISGQRFSLGGEIAVSYPVTTSTTAQLDFSAPLVPPTPSTTASLPRVEVSDIDENEIASIPVPEAVEAEVAPVQQKQEELTFLEEIMLDEFAAASTNHLATWTESSKKPEPEPIDEEQKAALRRELMGSFLLE